MVRILSCHHFRSQRIGRCDEAVDVAVTGENVILVALDHQINVYGSLGHDDGVDKGGSPLYPSPPPGGGLTSVRQVNRSASEVIAAGVFSSESNPVQFQESIDDFGGSFQYSKSEKVKKSFSDKNAESRNQSNELIMSHSFATIDLIDKIVYNNKGKYILCLEMRENSSHSSVRSYFNWEQDHGNKPMRARIAGLVSPTCAEPEDDCLMMVELSLSSPATAVASCDLTGHIACLSAESIINIFLFRTKEMSGRMKVNYYDFDRTYAVETAGFIPDQINLMSNYLTCSNSNKVHVFRIQKQEMQDLTIPDSSPFGTLNVKNHQNLLLDKENISNIAEKVIFDPKDESIRVYLPSIMRANRKRKSPSILIQEEFQDEIFSHLTKMVFKAVHSIVIVQDIVRIAVVNASNNGGNNVKISDVKLYPVRIKDHLGAIAMMVCTSKEAYLYHLPCKPNCSALRIDSYSFTAPLISLVFDSLFFHGLTETGLESYTNRSLYQAIKDVEGIEQYVSDCPMHEQPPSLVGIRPFLNICKIACNTSTICMLGGSVNNIHKAKSDTSISEEPTWTIYTLDLPEIETVYDDMIKTALQLESNPESHFSLLCEAYIVLKLFTESHPDCDSSINQRYKDICKRIGLYYLKSSISTSGASNFLFNGGIQSTISDITSSNDPSDSSILTVDSSMPSISHVSEQLIEKGLTFLFMGRCGVQEIFSPENWTSILEPCYIPGFVRLIEATFLKPKSAAHISNNRLSPTIAPIVVEFLSSNRPKVLLDLVIEAPFIRESNSKRLLQILQQLAENSGYGPQYYGPKETLALVLVIVTVGGADLKTREHVKDVLSKTKMGEFEVLLTKNVLLETRGDQTFLTDLSICIITSDHQNIVTEKLIQSLRTREISSVSIVITAFTQAINLNSESTVQQALSKCCTTLLEAYIIGKCTRSDLSTNIFSEDDKRAVQLVIRAYLSNINFANVENVPCPVEKDPHCKQFQCLVKKHDKNSKSKSPPPGEIGTLPQHSPATSPESNKDKSFEKIMSPDEILKRCEIYGPVCSCINYLLSVNSPDGYLTPHCENIASVPFFVNLESRENYIKLLSVLSNPMLSNLEGVKDIVLTFLYKNVLQGTPQVNSTLYIILQIIAEIPEKSVSILLAKQPTTMLLFAKETFENVPYKWKILVIALKQKLQTAGSNVLESEVYATILERIYLHLANSLSPSELEQVLDKESEESTKFHAICKRVEIANIYTSLVIAVSTEYLNKK